MGVGRDITDALDPVLVAAGFAAGQGGDGPGPAGITYCTGHDKDHFPWTPQAEEYPRGDDSCIDLVVEANAQGFTCERDEGTVWSAWWPESDRAD